MSRRPVCSVRSGVVVAPALLAFIGGVLAVAIKGWIDFVLEQRRERRAVRATTRLLRAELGDARAYLQVVLKDGGQWWRVEPPPFDAAAWDQHRYLVAAWTNVAEWHLVALAYRSMRGLRARYEHDTQPGLVRGPLREEDRAYLEVELEMLKTAIDRLADMESAPLPLERAGRLLTPRHAYRRWRAAATNKSRPGGNEGDEGSAVGESG